MWRLATGFQVGGRDSSGDYAFSFFCGTRNDNSAGVTFVCVDDPIDRSFPFASFLPPSSVRCSHCTAVRV
jgi:hypothetical protein